MGARPLTDLGKQMLTDLPSALQNSADYQAVMHAYAREVERFEATLEGLRAEFNPATADVLLPAWEYMLKLPVGGAGASIDQRRQKVLGRMLKQLGQSEGRDWEASITEAVGSGWSYEEHDPADPTTPAANTLRITLPFPAGGSAYAEATMQIRDITAAHLALEFVSAGGFVLDESQLDVQGLGGN